MSDLEIYESWDELELNFNPYLLTEEINNNGFIELANIDSSLTINQFEMYLRSLIKNSYNIFVQKIIEQTTGHYSIKDEKEIPSHILTLINELFSMETNV